MRWSGENIRTVGEMRKRGGNEINTVLTQEILKKNCYPRI